MNTECVEIEIENQTSCRYLSQKLSQRIGLEKTVFGKRDIEQSVQGERRRGLVGVKIDVQKAYDRLERQFLLQVLRLFGLLSPCTTWSEWWSDLYFYHIFLNAP